MSERQPIFLTPRMAATMLLMAGWACAEPSATAPDDEEPTQPVVAAVVISADIGPVLAPGATTTLTAAASDAQGGDVSTSFTWTSSNTNVAEVGSDGLLSALAPGDVTISAEADGVSGQLTFTVADLDLTLAERLLDDPMADGLMTAIGASREAVVRAAWTDCQGALDAGDVTGLSGCLTPLDAALDEGDSTSAPLRTVLTLFAQALDRVLDID